MRKLLFSLSLLPVVAFATDLDMSNLKCRNLQIYASTTLQEVQDNCLIYRQFEHQKHFDKFSGEYEVQFYSTSPQDYLVRCDFATKDPKSSVLGCR